MVGPGAGGPHGPRSDDDAVGEVARRLVALLATTGRTCAVAESLTGGLVTDALVSVPGASVCLRGGVVAYATDVKHTLLGVDDALLGRVGAVHREVAAQMASGVRTRLGADVGLATTGVAGPDPQDGHPAGTVHVAVIVGEGSPVVHDLALPGGRLGRAGVRSAATEAVLTLALDLLDDDAPAGPPG